ncbi:MAG TPA: tRNA preQ1(34) S-adenosylmethionine ribosyltransferase-isomerase QueA [Candidatus Binatia bacterium]|nr:tRNA preQ1(34) S-adenosylmethionine ribosyltransferase-isomerase QueA [Candidatus Binatia bacterium]
MSLSLVTEHLVSDYDYPLRAAAIAQRPLPDRDASRLLVIEGTALSDHHFLELPDLLRPGDLLVANDTRVRLARLRGRRPGGGAAELLVLGHLGDNRYACLTRPARRLHEGTVVEIDADLSARVEGPAPGHPGARVVLFETASDPSDAIQRAGSVPLPPYIRAPLRDPDRYQTVFAAGPPASAAAPTAGLHFTERLLEQVRERGIRWATIRLEVGLGTFAPMTSARVEDHLMHEEHFCVPEATARQIAETRERRGRVVAVGSTAVRALETAASRDGSVRAGDAETRLFIRPGHRFRVVDGVLTNFHQPRSSLLVMVAALIGPAWRDAYAHALGGGYRFLSFGDCMLAWRAGARSGPEGREPLP